MIKNSYNRWKFFSLLLLVSTGVAPVANAESLRPPAVPLVTFDPYLSIWSEADQLTDKNTQHWTHHEHSLVSLIRVDGKTYRLMGAEPANVPALAQVSLQVLPTRSIYEFEDAGRSRHADLHDGRRCRTIWMSFRCR